MVCNGVAGVGSSSNMPEKKPVQQAPAQQEEVSAWNEVKDGVKKAGNFIYDHTLTGALDKELNLGIKDGTKRAIKNGIAVVNDIADGLQDITGGAVKVGDTLFKHTATGALYYSIFGDDDK